MTKFVIFSGTTEGRMLSAALAAEGASVTVCVATEYGREEQGEIPGVAVHTGRMEAAEMSLLMKDTSACIDATHPYAAVVSQNIRAACETTQVPYLRLLRGESDLPEGCVKAASAAEAVEFLEKTEGNILLATGAKELALYAPLGLRLFPRVLPSVESISACMDAGIPRANIIAMQGPFSRELNEALMGQFHIQYMVTKDGGAAGGFTEKLEAARSCHAVPVVIARPADRGEDYETVLQQCREMMKCR